MGIENKLQQQQMQDKVVVLRKRRQRIKTDDYNWKMFFYQFAKDHSKPNLIWNFKTREELRLALEDELRAFKTEKDLCGSGCIIAWNHQEFEVHYSSLAEEIKIGNYYLRILLEEDENCSSEDSVIKQSFEIFNDLYHRFLLSPKSSMKCMCLQAMAIVYGWCHESIGPFNDTKYIVAMLERCTDRLERDRLILFLSKLVLNKTNVKDIIEANGIRILVDLLTLAHMHISRATVPMQSNVIEAAPNMQRESEKEWHYGNADKETLGPLSFVEMKSLWEEGVIGSKTRCWAQGMDGWRPLQQVPQLKWSLLASAQQIMNETEMAVLILNLLVKMTEYYPSRDAYGAIVRPLPKIKKCLSDPTCLPHIVQLLLTFDPIIVERVSSLLNLVMDENPVMPRLYLSGIFYFILMYTGSNVLPVAKFLRYTHLRQAFRSDEHKGSDIYLKSILGHLLPEAMVCYLENYEPEKFAEIFLGEFDTPEAIWNREMRRIMIEKIACHVSEFSPRLQSNTRAIYQYCPIPVVIFPQLENELFCNIFYLRHLCDVTRFPNWPIKEPVQLLKDILEAWKFEIGKKPPTLSVEDACQTLELKQDIKSLDESTIRKAYFRLAQKYHPDKNPDGREMFEKVNKAYEFLCSRAKITEGPDPQNIVLILKTQSILFERFKTVLEPYKYAGYPMLIKTISMESRDDGLFSKSIPLLSTAAELCYHTVNCSALNAEELRRENGIEVLNEAFSRCVGVLSKSSCQEDLAVQVCCHVIQTFGVSAQFDACRIKILEIPSIVKDISRVLYYKNVPVLCQRACECISLFSVDFWLQSNLYRCGVLWHLLLFLFDYDFTLEEGGVQRDNKSNAQEVLNDLAKLAVISCSRLGGYVESEPRVNPDNPLIKKSLCALILPYLSKKLAYEQPTEILKILNSNTENPVLIWNNETRMELVEFLTDQQLAIIRTGECDEAYGANFQYSCHSKELLIGDVFVRVFNQQPTFSLENPKAFTIDLLDYLGSQAQYLHTLGTIKMKVQLQRQLSSSSPIDSATDATSTDTSIERISHIEVCLEALHNVIKYNIGVEVQCIGHFKLLFSLLTIEGYPKVQQHSLEVISCVTANQDCVNDIAASEVMSYLLLVITSLPQFNTLTLQVLHPLISNTKLLKEIIYKGGLLYLLDLYCNSTSGVIRQQTAELFSRMLGDKLIGPKVRILMNKFLPGIFMDAMRDSPEASVTMFEGTHENPELIWNEESRSKVCEGIKRMKEEHYSAQHLDPTMKWSPPDNFTSLYTLQENELIVGEVYLRLYIANPGWVVRKPKEFMVELLERWTQMVKLKSIDGENLETITTALVSFLSLQSTMLDQVPQLGHLPKIFNSMFNDNEAIPKSALLIVQQLTNNEACIRSMAQIESVTPMKAAMKTQRDTISVACDGLMKMFQIDDDGLVVQALKADLLPFLLKLLESGLETLEKASSVKAQIVKAIKAMQMNLKYAEQINEILEKFPIWSDYKNQRHDLFLTDRPNIGYLTGPGVAGYLTSGTTNSTCLNKPPPII